MMTAKSLLTEPLRRNRSYQEAMRKPEQMLGSLLVAKGFISENDVAQILEEQTKSKELFGVVATKLGLVRDEQVFHALSIQYEFPITLGDTELSADLYIAHEPFSKRSEAIRSLRSELLLRYVNDARKTVAVASTKDDEGRSAVAANLAIAFAQAGERTLLIDANLRESAQAELFNISTTIGLSTLLSGRIPLKQAMLASDSFENLVVICAGPYAPNPQELLSRVTFSYLMETLPATFDVVIVDTPSMLHYSDAHIVAARAGACVLIAKTNETRLSDLTICKTKLDRLGVEVLGVVINN